MTIRPFCNATGKHTSVDLDRLRGLAGNETENVEQLADPDADFKASSRARMDTRRIRGAYLMDGQSCKSANLNVLAAPNFLQALEPTVDRLYRLAPGGIAIARTT